MLFLLIFHLAYSTHWSNVVGASHSPNYVIWEYGGYASDGVQKVAEWGWPNDVETEIRAQGDDVLSVLKTKAQWPAYEPRNMWVVCSSQAAYWFRKTVVIKKEK